MIKLSLRLKKIAKYVDDYSNIVDIGCDHGLLDIYLVQTNKNIKIIASDVNENALNNAINNIKKYNLENKITTILSNGLDNIDTTNIDTIIIAGMGSHTVVSILKNNPKKLKPINESNPKNFIIFLNELFKKKAKGTVVTIIKTVRKIDNIFFNVFFIFFSFRKLFISFYINNSMSNHYSIKVRIF